MKMEKMPNKKTSLIFAIAIAVVILAYIVTMNMPLFTYTRTNPAEVAGQEDSVSIVQYTWKPYQYKDLTSGVLADAYKAETGERYAITDTIAVPLFAFLMAFIALVVILALHSKFWSVFFPIIWSLGSLIGYLVSPLLNLSICNKATTLVHIILFAVTLVLSIISFIVYSIPKRKYDIAHREIY